MIEVIKTIYQNPAHVLAVLFFGLEEDIRIAVLMDEIALWEKRCDTEPRSNLYYGYIRDMLTNRVKELSAEQEK